MNRDIMLEANNKLGGAMTTMIVLHDIGLCPACGEKAGEFRDELSRKEFKISGLCQKCQDIIFKED